MKTQLILFTGVLLLFFAACTNEEPANSEAPTSETTEEIESEATHDHLGADHHHSEDQEPPIDKLKLENLLREKLELTEGVEVIMTYLDVPVNTTLPLHYHPGEEFVYVLDGSGEVILPGEDNVLLKKGDVFKIPLEQVHTFKTLDETASAVVFRVHKEGQPDRILVEE